MDSATPRNMRGNFLENMGLNVRHVAIDPLRPEKPPPRQGVAMLESGFLQGANRGRIGGGAENPGMLPFLANGLGENGDHSGIVSMTPFARRSPAVKQHHAVRI